MSTLHASQDLINLIKQINLDINYPIGSIYLSFDKNSPGSRLGGTWQLCGSGRYLMCYDPNNSWFDKPGSDRGTASGPGNWRDEGTTLTINQMPSHNHGQDSHAHYVGHYRNWEFVKSMGYYSASGGSVWPRTGNGASNSGDNYAMATENKQPAIWYTGGGQPHSHFHVSPYMTVCVWERIA